jgi:hypothetical protein
MYHHGPEGSVVYRTYVGARPPSYFPCISVYLPLSPSPSPAGSAAARPSGVNAVFDSALESNPGEYAS